MKKIIVRMLSGLLVFVLGLSFSGLSAFGANRYVNYNLYYDWANHNYIAEEVFLKVDGEVLTDLPMPPVILNNYTLVPAREVFEKTGAVVSWNADREEVYVAKGNDLVILKINSTTAYYNNKEAQMQIPAKLINSKTMIPVRFVSETLGYEVIWDKPTRTVIINSEPAETTEATTEAVTEKAAEITTEKVTEATTSEVFEVVKIGTDTEGLPDNLYELTDANHYDCNITDISQGENYIKITADDELSKIVSGAIADGRFYLDIYAAKSEIGRVKMAVSVGGISEIRVGERFEDKYNITRIAMDSSDSKFKVKMTGDRKNIYIYYPEPEITDYKLVTETSDIFTVMGAELSKPVVAVSDDKIIATFKNTELKAAEQTLRRKSLYIETTQIEQSGADAVLTFNLKEGAAYRTEVTDTKVTITIYQASYQNINTDDASDVITLKKTKSVNLEAITEEDDYLNLKYKITLPGNLSGEYGEGDIYFDNSDRLNSLNISYSGGNTVLTFSEKTVSAFVITEDKNNIYISCVDIHDKYDKIVVLDAGHGGRDPGTSGNGIVEKDIALDIVLKIQTLLENDGEIKAYLTRTGDTYPTLGERSAFGNMVDCPFVSVHVNSGGTSNTTASGIEVYWQYVNTDENGLTSTKLANAVYEKLIEYTGANERGVKTSNLQVLREAKNPAVLIETGFITNKAEAANLAENSYRQKIANAVFEALKECL